MKYLVLLLSMISCFSYANCEDKFLDQTPPSPSSELREVCFNHFTVLYDGNKKIPIYSAEYLSIKDAINSEGIQRNDAFHVEYQLPDSEQSSPADYSKSGYDKGHLTPSHDAPTVTDQRDTFSMSNMVPQTPKSNEVAIRIVEAKVHEIVETGTGAHIVTGVIVGDNPNTIGRGVVVPDDTFKAVHFDDGTTCVWVFPNTVQLSETVLLSLDQFNHQYGILPFPGLPTEDKISPRCR